MTAVPKSYGTDWSPSALSRLRQLPEPDRSQVLKGIEQLSSSTTPAPVRVRKLATAPGVLVAEVTPALRVLFERRDGRVNVLDVFDRRQTRAYRQPSGGAH